jgi:hypothetical protein
VRIRTPRNRRVLIAAASVGLTLFALFVWPTPDHTKQELVGGCTDQRWILPIINEAAGEQKLKEKNFAPIYASVRTRWFGDQQQYLTWLTYEEHLARQSPWFAGSPIYSDEGGGWRVVSGLKVDGDSIFLSRNASSRLQKTSWDRRVAAQVVAGKFGPMQVKRTEPQWIRLKPGDTVKVQTSGETLTISKPALSLHLIIEVMNTDNQADYFDDDLYLVCSRKGVILGQFKNIDDLSDSAKSRAIDGGQSRVFNLACHSPVESMTAFTPVQIMHSQYGWLIEVAGP